MLRIPGGRGGRQWRAGECLHREEIPAAFARACAAAAGCCWAPLGGWDTQASRAWCAKRRHACGYVLTIHINTSGFMCVCARECRCPCVVVDRLLLPVG